MEVFECVSTLSSIRVYDDRKVDMETVRKVIEAGRLAPSAHNDQPWEFIIINEKDRLQQMAKYCISGSFIIQVSFAVVVLTDPRSKWREIDTTRAGSEYGPYRVEHETRYLLDRQTERRRNKEIS